MNAISASLGIFSINDAARLTGVDPRRIRGWLQGYAQRKGKPSASPILRHQHPIRNGELALGFLDLLEVDFLGRLVTAAERRGRSPSWKSVRAAADTARRIMNTDHPFAARRMHTDGRTIFFEAKEETKDPALYDLVADNFAILDVLVDSFIASIEFENDEPRTWTPDDRFPRIIVSPNRAFGRPIEKISGTPAETLFDAWKAEGGRSAKVASWFATDKDGVDQAVHFMLGIGLGVPQSA